MEQQLQLKFTSSLHSVIPSASDYVNDSDTDDTRHRRKALKELVDDCVIVVISTLAQKQKLEEFIRTEIWPDYSDRGKFSSGE